MIVKCYVALGNLGMVKEDGEMARQNYEKALNLIHAENTSNPNGTRVVSAGVELEIVQKLINVLNITNNNLEARKYEQLHDALKR